MRRAATGAPHARAFGLSLAVAADYTGKMTGRARVSRARVSNERSLLSRSATDRTRENALPPAFSSSLVSSRVRVVLEGPADLDGTLYAIENGYEDACRARVFQFMVDELGFADAHAAKAAWRPQFQKHNQTLRALRSGLGLTFDENKYWTVTRGDPREVLKTNADALAALAAADDRARRDGKTLKKYVFTNCAEKQARESLEALGLLACFDGVFGADVMGDTCKPSLEAFRKVQKIAGFEFTKAAFFEDSVKNLATAKTLGVTTVLVASATAIEEGVRSDGFEPDHVVSAVTASETKRVLPGVFG